MTRVQRAMTRALLMGGLLSVLAVPAAAQAVHSLHLGAGLFTPKSLDGRSGEDVWAENLNAWDVAAGALLVEEAGGRVTDYRGGPYSPFGREIVASNGALHPRLLDVITGLRR